MTDRPNTISGSIDQLPAQIAPAERRLTAAEFQRLADVPPEVEWFANIKNPSTKRAYENATRDFIRFTGIARPEEFRTVALGMQSLALPAGEASRFPDRLDLAWISSASAIAGKRTTSHGSWAST
jgi:hypothetical protein